MALPRELYPSGDIPRDEIEDHLKADAHSIEERYTYYRPITEEERQTRLEQMPKLDIRLADLETERKAKNDELKGQMKPLAADKAKMLTEVRTQQIQETGPTYTLLFHEEKMAGVYNKFGQLISERRMTQEERQYRMPL